MDFLQKIQGGMNTSPQEAHLNSIVGVQRRKPGRVVFKYCLIVSGLYLYVVISVKAHPAKEMNNKAMPVL